MARECGRDFCKYYKVCGKGLHIPVRNFSSREVEKLSNGKTGLQVRELIIIGGREEQKFRGYEVCLV